MFSDEAEIIIQSGKGGDGCVSFRREKYVPYGGPDGGDGGNGGDVIFKVRNSLRSLSWIRSRHLFKAQNGQNGMKQRKSGKHGEPCIVEVPPGTIIKNIQTDVLLADLSHDTDEIVIAHGGRGGKGNTHFMTSTNQAPKYAQDGKEGIEIHLKLEVKLIADIGLVGKPNAGKSTLLSRLTKAHPKIGNYPFTTLYPNLGVMYISEFDSITIADIPGLIEGAHKGAGLGIRFLKHIERTKALLYMIDFYEEDPFQQFQLLFHELNTYHPDLVKKPFYIALNKIDVMENQIHQEKFKLLLSEITTSPYSELITKDNIFLISAVTGEGLETLKNKLYHLVETHNVHTTNNNVLTNEY